MANIVQLLNIPNKDLIRIIKEDNRVIFDYYLKAALKTHHPDNGAEADDFVALSKLRDLTRSMSVSEAFAHLDTEVSAVPEVDLVYDSRETGLGLAGFYESHEGFYTLGELHGYKNFSEDFLYDIEGNSRSPFYGDDQSRLAPFFVRFQVEVQYAGYLQRYFITMPYDYEGEYRIHLPNDDTPISFTVSDIVAVPETGRPGKWCSDLYRAAGGGKRHTPSYVTPFSGVTTAERPGLRIVIN